MVFSRKFNEDREIPPQKLAILEDITEQYCEVLHETIEKYENKQSSEYVFLTNIVIFIVFSRLDDPAELLNCLETGDCFVLQAKSLQKQGVYRLEQ